MVLFRTDDENENDKPVSRFMSGSKQKLWFIFVLLLVAWELFNGFFVVVHVTNVSDAKDMSSPVVHLGRNNTNYTPVKGVKSRITKGKETSSTTINNLPPAVHDKNTLNNTNTDEEAEWIRSTMTPRQVRTIAAYYHLDYDAFNLTKPPWFFRSTWDGPGANIPDFSVDYNMSKMRQEDDALCKAHSTCMGFDIRYWSGELECIVCKIYKVMSSSLPSILPKSSNSIPKQLTASYLSINLPKQYTKLTNKTLSKEQERSLLGRIIEYQRTNLTHHVVVVRDPVFRFGSMFRWLCHWKNWECKIGPTTNFTQFYKWFFEETDIRHLFHHAKSQTQFCNLHDEEVRSMYRIFHYRKDDIEVRLREYAGAREEELMLRYSTSAGGTKRPSSEEDMLEFLIKEVIGSNIDKN